MGALLTISSVEAAEAATCDCIAKPPQHRAVALRHAPAHIIHPITGADAEYAQSYYNYNSSSHVGEVFIRSGYSPVMRDEGGQPAPNDAHIPIYHDERVVYGPGVYPQPYYPPAYFSAVPGVSLDDTGWGGGVGHGMADGGGGGGQAFLYGGQTGGQAEPANGGGVTLPRGYGPDYHGNWQGPVVPTAGGGAKVGR